MYKLFSTPVQNKSCSCLYGELIKSVLLHADSVLSRLILIDVFCSHTDIHHGHTADTSFMEMFLSDLSMFLFHFITPLISLAGNDRRSRPRRRWRNQ